VPCESALVQMLGRTPNVSLHWRLCVRLAKSRSRWGLPASAFAPQPLSKGCCRDWAGSIENQIGEWKPGNTHHHADSGRES
jgi:hypothetical protein